MEKHPCSIENAPKFADWVKNRGGIAVWKSVNLSNPGASWSTPANDKEGKPTAKPTWQADNRPEQIITDPDQVEVYVGKEIKRFRVGVKRGDGFNFVLTDGASRRLKRELAKAGEESFYVFDYSVQEAVILLPDNKITLAEWMEEQVLKKELKP
jgi:hypothetical protein